MTISPRQFAAIEKIEGLIHQDVGRHMDRAFAITKGNLVKAAASIADTERPNIGIITGFFIERAQPVAAETDGPLGAALMAFALTKIGINCRIITDTHCANVCQAALNGAGAESVPVTIVSDSPLSLLEHTSKLYDAGLTHVISTERPGRSQSGEPRNMRGELIKNCVHFDDLFENGPWMKIAVGDGGNEIGMGALPFKLVAKDIAYGPEIACTTSADALITAGVSNWGTNGLMAALAVLRPQWKAAICSALKPEKELGTLQAMVDAGAVDGINFKHELSVDNMPISTHLLKTQSILNVVEDAANSSGADTHIKAIPRTDVSATIGLTGSGRGLSRLSA